MQSNFPGNSPGASKVAVAVSSSPNDAFRTALANHLTHNRGSCREMEACIKDLQHTNLSDIPKMAKRFSTVALALRTTSNTMQEDWRIYDESELETNPGKTIEHSTEELLAASLTI